MDADTLLKEIMKLIALHTRDLEAQLEDAMKTVEILDAGDSLFKEGHTTNFLTVKRINEELFRANQRTIIYKNLT